MESRWVVLIIVLGLLVGLIFGVAAGSSLLASAAPPVVDSVVLDPPAQDDFIIMVAEAYAGDHNLQLARDRLGRLKDDQYSARVERLAAYYAPQRDLIATQLAILAVSLGSKNRNLLTLSASATPSATPTLTSTPTATDTPTLTATPTASTTPTPKPTLTRAPTRRPATRVGFPTLPPTQALRPAPGTVFEPGFPDRWPPGVYFQAANVQPGEKYWHLAKATYCDFVEDNFGCPDLPGNRDGTSIYVMTGGAPLDVIRPDGVNVGSDPAYVGDLKAPSDMCLCSWTFLVSDYRISVAGAPSDAIGGFALYTVGGNVLAGHAHVRYFLYFEYITR